MKPTTSQSECLFEMSLTFGQVVRTARSDKGYSQRQLATLVEIDFTYLSKLESDRTEYPPKEYVVQQLAYYLGLDSEELMCLTLRLPEWYQDFLAPELQGNACTVMLDAAQSASRQAD